MANGNQQKRLQADTNAQKWLAEANRRIETGAVAKRIAEAERKAQYWLDRLNRLEGLDSDAKR
jgi:hypothetical protein